jgi:uncharacterized C2H2 Zn-finger protein
MTTTLRDFDGGADDIEAATIVDVGGDDCERLKLLRCPACGTPFHRQGGEQSDPVARHVHLFHDPVDFGLSERGERR